MRIATVQPCYLPWKGYFHLIESVDHFVFFDDVQYPRGRTWRNRNQIVVNGAPKWINVPVDRSAWRMNINEVAIREPFADEHWRLIAEAYRKAAYFERYENAVEDIVRHDEKMLSRLTVHQTRELCRLLGIETPTSLSSELRITGLHKTDRLVEMCRRLGATEYVSGPSARDYIDEEKFTTAAIKLSYFEYQYPAYRQLSNEFTHFVSIIDMIFNLGPEAPNYIWGEAMKARLAIDGGTPVREQFLVFGQPVLGQEEIDEIVDTLKSAWIGTGPRTQRFEKAFAEYIGTSNALAVNSCTAGLHLALLAAGVGPGDEVPVTALTFVASSNVIVHCGATPVFVDIDPDTLNLDLGDLERKITRRTKAVMPVHFAGLPVDLASLDAIVSARGIKVIEDAAHAVGASIDGRKIGSGKNLTAFSFYANKNMTTGEGGMLTADGLGADTLDYLVAMRLHGLSNDAWRRFHTKAMIQSEVIGAGYKYNMTDLQAALGLHQLQRLEGFLAKREAIAARYRRELADLPGVRFQQIPDRYGRLRHGLHLFVLLLERKAFRVDRDTVVAALRAENIGATVHYGSVPTHRYYRETFPDAHRGTPVANEVGDTILSLPLRPDFTERDTADVVEAVRKVLRHYAR